MKTFEHILVPTDFGETSARAARMACELAQKFDAKVTLLHVWTVPYASYYEGMTIPLDELQKAARGELEREATRLRDAFPRLSVTTKLDGGLPWRTIVEAIEELGADLVVIGTHGRRGLPRLLLGSVAEKVVRSAPVPVLTVRPPDEE